jgi:acyl carrier protein
MGMDERTAQIRRILETHARLSRRIEAVSDTDDLYQAGMTSHASVNVMLALEGQFDVEFPDHLLRRDVFDSIASMRQAIESLLGAGQLAANGDTRS